MAASESTAIAAPVIRDTVILRSVILPSVILATAILHRMDTGTARTIALHSRSRVIFSNANVYQTPPLRGSLVGDRFPGG